MLCLKARLFLATLTLKILICNPHSGYSCIKEESKELENLPVAIQSLVDNSQPEISLDNFPFEEDQTKPQFFLLSSVSEHMKTLQESINSAKEDILITTYGMASSRIDQSSIFLSLQAAVKRGVRVYIYNNDEKGIDDKTLEFLGYAGITYAQYNTHTKVFIVDRSIIGIGSFNCLALHDEQAWGDHTICTHDSEIISTLKKQIWQQIRYFRNVQYRNNKQVKRYERNSYNRGIICWELNDTDEIQLLRSLKAHQDFIKDCL